VTKSARTASARIFLALAVAVLILAGCGGGSSDSSSSSTASTPSSDSSGSSGNSGSAASNDSAGEAGSTASPAKKASKGGSSAGGEGQQPSSGKKQGSSVPQPVGEEEPGITPEQRRQATVASMTLQSPSAPSGGLSAEYTCDGKGTSPALRWQGVPDGTAELVLFAMNTQPVGGKLFFDWAVAGLTPDLDEIEAGGLPRGAVVGRNSFGKAGYKICPEGDGETYIFALFALPKKLSPSQGFEPFALRKEVSEASGNAGLLPLSYLRG
jgi:phosphatidylethanolamine-binding protein (PEBP) family uncharacterized protein